MKRVALYARVSTHGQDAAPQLVYLREWAGRQGLQVAGEFIEVVSGRLHRRPEMDKVMSLVRGHHVHAVAVRKLDRWGRSLMNLRTTVEEMVEASVTFHAVESGITYEKHTPTGKLFLSQLAAFAEFEADLISERTKDGLAGKTASGKPWVSKAGRTVERLGRPLVACHDCGSPRFGPKRIRGKRAGIVVPLCEPCKRGDRNGDAFASQAAASEMGASGIGRLRIPELGQDPGWPGDIGQKVVARVSAPEPAVGGHDHGPVGLRGHGTDGHDGLPLGDGFRLASSLVLAPGTAGGFPSVESANAGSAAGTGPDVGHTIPSTRRRVKPEVANPPGLATGLRGG